MARMVLSGQTGLELRTQIQKRSGNLRTNLEMNTNNMKKIIVIALLCMMNNSIYAQYGSHRAKKDTLVTSYTYETRTGVWKIIINKKSGSCYYWCKTRDGKIAQRYCPSEISEEVSSKYGIKYKSNKRRRK